MLSMHVEIFESIGRLGVALALGSVIGFERQWHQKMAGLWTNALVALGSCGFVVFSSMVGEGDPTRVAAQVVTGIGFLGAGIILREGINVHGLNTAATLWCSAMVGTFARRRFLGAQPGGYRVCSRHQPPAASSGTADQHSNRLDGRCRDLLFRHTDVQKRGRSGPSIPLAACTFARRTRPAKHR